MISASSNVLTFSTIPPFEGLNRALSLTPAEIIAEVTASHLRGRGGAGFPTGTKWQYAAGAKREPRYIICNADEGEPGTFKDRVLLSEHAELVLDGMTIAARAIGASHGYIYLRAEYTYLRPQLERALEERRAAGRLGASIGGIAGFDFDISLFMGAGAYICGEESALIESMEGFRGEPRNRPPFPVTKGYLGQPTIINNVETFAWVASILVKGADWFKTGGTERSTGWKIFSISGDCERPGVYEFPLGLTVQALLKAVGGEGAKAVQIGGFSGSCLPASQFDRRICFEDVATGGSIIIFGPQRSMVGVAKNIMEFFADESCGQCTPCRLGNVKILEGIERLEAGKCSTDDLKELLALGETMQVASKCGLGQSSPNAFMTIVRHFQEELMSGAPSPEHERN